MGEYEKLCIRLSSVQYTWLVTGVAGFIGSNLLEQLLRLNQKVIGVDNYETGHHANIAEVLSKYAGREELFHFIEADICDLEAMQRAVEGVDFVLHQAAIGSVPRSIANPLRTHQTNVDGFLNVLIAARDAKVKRFVYAASSSTYGDHRGLPKVEDRIGNPLSPYAVTKYVNELYANVFSRVYGIETIGLRYFNVFGRRQDPDGAYAAVIPKWIMEYLRGGDIFINGDGETTRDFCYVDNAVQANLLAATTTSSEATNTIYNVALGDQTSLNQLFGMIARKLRAREPALKEVAPVYRDFREGDVRHSRADIQKAKMLLGYAPSHRVDAGLDEALDWYVDNLR